MWPAALLTSGAAAFGRLFLVQFLPSLIVVLPASLLYRAGVLKFDGSIPTLDALVPLSSKTDTSGLLLILAATVVLAAITGNFQIGMVRVLEGYTGSGLVGLWLSEVGSSFERRRFSKIEDRYRNTPTQHDFKMGRDLEQLKTLSLPAQVKIDRDLRRRAAIGSAAQRQLLQYPPDPDDILPTRLGNSLRSMEQRAGERYGYGTLDWWPRLYPHIGDRLSTAFHSSVDALDAAANFVHAFLFLSLLTSIAFIDTGRYLWVSGVCLLLAWLSYRAAVVAAGMQSVMEFVSFDLHRFDVLRALHIALPTGPSAELVLARSLTAFLRDGHQPGDFAAYFPDASYSHQSKDE